MNNQILKNSQFQAEINGKLTGLSGCPNHCNRDCIRQHSMLPIFLRLSNIQNCQFFIKKGLSQ